MIQGTEESTLVTDSSVPLMHYDPSDLGSLILIRGGGILGISGWGCAAGTLEPLAYTRVSSAEFCYPILE